MRTKWEGLWKTRTAVYRSKPITQKQIKEMPKKMRLIIRENRYHSNNDDGTPRFVFMFADGGDADAITLDVLPPKEVVYDGENYYIKCDNPTAYICGMAERVYTQAEARAIINGTFDDVKYGISDPLDILPDDFV